MRHRPAVGSRSEAGIPRIQWRRTLGLDWGDFREPDTRETENMSTQEYRAKPRGKIGTPYQPFSTTVFPLLCDAHPTHSRRTRCAN